MSLPSLSRRVLGAVAATGLLVGLVPAAASAATPEPRDITEHACPEEEVPDPEFSDDENTTDEHEASIACVVWYEIARGQTTSSYGVGQAVNRGQMASFIGNLLVKAGVALPENPQDAFDDDDDTTHEKRINQVASVGVVDGFEDGEYKPHLAVTRAQMATFLNNAYEEITGTALTSSEDYFTDDDGTFHEDNINAVAGAGIAAGRTSTTYAPGNAVKREQMATFLARETDLLVEKGKVTKPVVRKADVKLTTTSVEQGGKVTGTVNTTEGVTITSAKVSGCGLSDKTLTLTGANNAFEFTIPVAQSTGECKLVFTFTLEGGETTTDEETITVTPLGSQTDAPELVRVSSSADGDNVKVTYTFDETLNAGAGADRAGFKLYTASADAVTPSAVTISGSSATATFTKAQYDSSTTAAVAYSAVEDRQNVPNPEGAKALQSRTNAAGETVAPDLIGLLTFEDKLNVRSFQFDAPAYDVGDASNYHLVFTDGSTAAGTEFEQADASARQGQDFRNVRFGEAHANKTIVRGWIDADTVSDAAQDNNVLTPPQGNTNPLQAQHKDATDPRPALVSVGINPAENTVTYTFNRGVTVVDSDPLTPGTQSDRFTAYKRDASEVRSDSATSSGSTVTATFSGDPDPITLDTIGAGMLSDAVQSNVGGQRNYADEKPAPQQTAAGRTAAPDLVSVSRSTSGSNTVITYTFDQPVSTTGNTNQRFTIYQEDGSRRELTFNNSGPGSSNDCSADGDKVVCTAATSSDTGKAMASAALGGVEADTVDDPNNSAYSNYETSLPIR